MENHPVQGKNINTVVLYKTHVFVHQWAYLSNTTGRSVWVRLEIDSSGPAELSPL